MVAYLHFVGCVFVFCCVFDCCDGFVFLYSYGCVFAFLLVVSSYFVAYLIVAVVAYFAACSHCWLRILCTTVVAFILSDLVCVRV